MPHLRRIVLRAAAYPTRDYYPFSLPVFQQTPALEFDAPVTIFVGENGTGKSTLLRAIADRCRFAIWGDDELPDIAKNPYQRLLSNYLEVEWTAAPVPGSFFSAQLFHRFSEMLEEFAEADPGQLNYFGGQSLVHLSHGQSLMSFFKARYRIPGLFLLDEPEAALSPKSLIELIVYIRAMADAGHAQFIICTHSPIMLACPGAALYSFDHCPITPVAYRETEHYRIYHDFLNDPSAYFATKEQRHVDH